MCVSVYGFSLCLFQLCICTFGYCEVIIFFFFKQKTAYEMRISDWSSDVCSSDLGSGSLSRFANSARMRCANRVYRLSFLTVLTARDSASGWATTRSEEHTSELQSLMRISYAVFCLKKKKNKKILKKQVQRD